MGLFVVSPKEWKRHSLSPCKVSLMMRSVQSLCTGLAKLGIPLVVKTANKPSDVPGVVLAAARELKCGGVYLNREYEVDETARDNKVSDIFDVAGLETKMYHDQCCVPPIKGLVVSGSGNPYKVYTPFKKKWWNVVRNRPTGDDYLMTVPSPAKQEPPAGVQGVEAEAIPVDIEPFASSGPSYADAYPAGEAAATARLEAWAAKKIRQYSKQRNDPSVEQTSMLSPYLALGVVSARQCVAAARAANHGKIETGSEGCVVWIQEIIWRDFYRHVLYNWPHVCKNKSFKQEYDDKIEWASGAEADRRFDRWKQGMTGFPIVDAGMRQLGTTGWMHNRLRMIVANFLVKDLQVDWRRGERFFMEHLIDGDFASNNGGWQWAAGCGTDAQPYFRIFNPTSQSKKFDPQGVYIKRFVPELKTCPAAALHDMPPTRAKAMGYPVKMVNHKEARAKTLEMYAALKK